MLPCVFWFSSVFTMKHHLFLCHIVFLCFMFLCFYAALLQKEFPVCLVCFCVVRADQTRSGLRVKISIFIALSATP